MNLAEIALLAGLPKASSRYNPLVNPDLAIKRQQSVLNSMLRHGFIDKTTYILAIDQPIGLVENLSKYELIAKYVAEMIRKTMLIFLVLELRNECLGERFLTILVCIWGVLWTQNSIQNRCLFARVGLEGHREGKEVIFGASGLNFGRPWTHFANPSAAYWDIFW